MAQHELGEIWKDPTGYGPNKWKTIDPYAPFGQARLVHSFRTKRLAQLYVDVAVNKTITVSEYIDEQE